MEQMTQRELNTYHKYNFCQKIRSYSSSWASFSGSSDAHNWAKRDWTQWYLWGAGIGNSVKFTAIVDGDYPLRQGPNNPGFKENAENSRLSFNVDNMITNWQQSDSSSIHLAKEQ
jgi:hypothetical protein